MKWCNVCNAVVQNEDHNPRCTEILQERQDAKFEGYYTEVSDEDLKAYRLFECTSCYALVRDRGRHNEYGCRTVKQQAKTSLSYADLSTRI